MVYLIKKKQWANLVFLVVTDRVAESVMRCKVEIQNGNDFFFFFFSQLHTSMKE